MNNKEFKEYWSSKTLGEVKGYYEDRLRISESHKESIREKALELANLDFNHTFYVSKAKNLMNDISYYKSHIKDDETWLTILKPILDKKEIEGINQAEYEKYITNNTDVKVLIHKVNELKNQFIKDGHKVVIRHKKETIEIVLTLKEVDDMYDIMLKELIMILKDNIGNIKEAFRVEENGNRGLDGYFVGEKGEVNITTILAYGEVQRPHYRTLVYKR